MIVVFIIDCSGIITSIKSFISKRLTGQSFKSFSLKPFDCSLCMSFWVGLIFLLVTSQFSIISLFLVCLLSYLTQISFELLLLLKDILLYLINKIHNNIC